MFGIDPKKYGFLEEAQLNSSIVTNEVEEKLMSVKEVASVFDVSPEAIKRIVRKIFPEKMQNGKTTYLNEKEVTCISKELKSAYHLAQEEPTRQVCRLETTTELEILANYKAATDAYVLMLERKNEEKDRLLEQQKPKVEFYDAVTSSSTTFDMKDVAKILGKKNFGRNNLFEFLRDKGVLDNRNLPYQRYVNAGYFKIVETSSEDRDGNIHVNVKTVVFQKGIDFIRKLVKEA